MSPPRICKGVQQKREPTCPAGQRPSKIVEDRRGTEKNGLSKSLYTKACTNQLFSAPHPLLPNTARPESNIGPQVKYWRDLIK